MIDPKIYFIGDIQFSHLYKWSNQLNQDIIDYFLNYQFGPDDEIVQLGDVVEKSSNYGKITEDVIRLFHGLSKKVKHIYIICGNHDHKFLNGESQYFISFLKEFPNISIIDNEQEITTQNGFKGLFLPWKKVDNCTLDDYYSNELSETYYSTNYDFIAGHCAIKEKDFYFGGVNFSKFHYKYLIMGHIHTRNGPNAKYYTGSVAPLKISENETELPRTMMVIGQDRNIKELHLPIFVQYKEALYKSELKNQAGTKPVTIYIINGCSYNEALVQYPSNYIKSTIPKVDKKTISESKEKIFLDYRYALQSMIKENKISVSRKAVGYLNQIL